MAAAESERPSVLKVGGGAGGFNWLPVIAAERQGIFARRNLTIEVKRLGIPDLFVENGPPALLRSKYRIDTNGIVQEARGMLRGRLKNRIRAQRL